MKDYVDIYEASEIIKTDVEYIYEMVYKRRLKRLSLNNSNKRREKGNTSYYFDKKEVEGIAKRLSIKRACIVSSRLYKNSDFYRVVYCFHNNEDKRETAISEFLGFKHHYVSKVLTTYSKIKLNLSQLAAQAKDIESFSEICAEDDENESETTNKKKRLINYNV